MLRAAEEGSEATVKSVSVQAKLACVTAIRNPKSFKFDDLMDLRAVQALSSSDPDVFALLNVFMSGKLSDYTALVTAKKGLIKSLELDNDACVLKMSLLSVTSLASGASEIAYKQIAEDLGIDAAAPTQATNMAAWMGAVEGWVIRAIAAGLIEARLDQRRGVVEVSRSTQREFHDGDWAAVGQKLSAWRDHVQRMLMVVEKTTV
jgi:translation initiation factor 3 subunit M